MGFGGLGYPWKGHRLYFPSTLFAWEAWCTMLLLLVLALYPSISGSSGTPLSHLSNSFFELICFNSRLVSYFSGYGIEESHHFASRTIMYYIFLLHFTLVSFIFLYLSLSLNSNP